MSDGFKVGFDGDDGDDGNARGGTRTRGQVARHGRWREGFVFANRRGEQY
jgi:hypothetical protein